MDPIFVDVKLAGRTFCIVANPGLLWDDIPVRIIDSVKQRLSSFKDPTVRIRDYTKLAAIVRSKMPPEMFSDIFNEHVYEGLEVFATAYNRFSDNITVNAECNYIKEVDSRFDTGRLPDGSVFVIDYSRLRDMIERYGSAIDRIKQNELLVKKLIQRIDTLESMRTAEDNRIQALEAGLASIKATIDTLRSR